MEVGKHFPGTNIIVLAPGEKLKHKNEVQK